MKKLFPTSSALEKIYLTRVTVLVGMLTAIPIFLATFNSLFVLNTIF